MSSHAKHAATKPLASTSELAALGRSTKKVVFGGESFGNFDDCVLCLRTAVEPVCCPEGHVFCKECICKSLLHQRRVISEKQAAYKRMKAEKATEDALNKRQEKRELVEALCKIDAGIAVKALCAKPEELEKKQQQSKGNAVSATGSCFWLPSQTPTARASVSDITGTKNGEDVMKLKTMCPATKEKSPDAHALRLKQLIPLVFTDVDKEEVAVVERAAKKRREEDYGYEDEEGEAQKEDKQSASSVLKHVHQCPVCLRVLTNTRQCGLPKPCGHVACLECIRTLLSRESPSKSSSTTSTTDSKPALVGKCFVCGCSFSESEIVALREGTTGYSGHGGNLQVEAYLPLYTTKT